MDAPFVAQLRLKEGEIFRGTVFAVTKKHLFTCAHVWKDAQDSGPYLRFRELDQPASITRAHILPNSDIAILEVDGELSCDPVVVHDLRTRAQLDKALRLTPRSIGYACRDDGKEFCIEPIKEYHTPLKPGPDGDLSIRDVQVHGGFHEGCSGSPVLYEHQGALYCFGMLHYGGIGAGGSRFFPASQLIEHFKETVEKASSHSQNGHALSIVTRFPGDGESTISDEFQSTAEEKSIYEDGSRNPCKGLECYREADADLFFGRDKWIAEALEQFDKLWNLPASKPFFGIFGESGTGKSSLLEAGMLANLKNKEHRSEYLSCPVSAQELLDRSRPSASNRSVAFGETPLGRLTFNALNALGRPNDCPAIESKAKKKVRTVWPKLAVDELSRLLKLEQATRAKRQEVAKPLRMVIGLDQFEELLDANNESPALRQMLRPLLDFIQRASESGCIGFVYTCQNNRRDLLENEEILSVLRRVGSEKEVHFLDADDIKQVVVKKLELAGFDFGDLVDDFYAKVCKFALRESGAGSRPGAADHQSMASLLPLFSLAIKRIHSHCLKNRSALKRADKERRRQSGGKLIKLYKNSESFPESLLLIEDSISALAEEALNKVRDFPGISWNDDVIESLIHRLVRIQDSEGSRYSLPAVSIPEKGPKKVLMETLVQYRLMVPVGRDSYRLVHEAVLTHWTQAANSFAKKKALLEIAADLDDAARLWERKREKALALLDEEEIDRLGLLLSELYDAFRPADGTKPNAFDRRLREFGLAMLRHCNSPDRSVKTTESHTTHFLLAIAYGETELVSTFLARDPEAAKLHRNGKGANSVYIACCSRKLDMLDLVLASGSDPNVSNHFGWLPVHMAAEIGSVEMLKRLAAAGSDINALGLNGIPAHHLGASNDDLRTVEWLLSAEGADATVQSQSKWNLLHIAVRSASDKMVKWILENTDIDPSQKLSDEWNALHLACRYGSSKMVEMLLDAGLDPSETEASGWNALHLACRYGNPQIVAMLLKHENLDPAATTGHYSPLELAVAGKSPEVIETLLQDERIETKATKPAGKSLIDLAIGTNEPSVLAALLNDSYERIDAKEAKRALSGACKNHQIEAVEILLESGVSPNASKDDKFNSPFLETAKSHEVDALKLLLKFADKRELDSHGRNALHLAAMREESDCLEELLKHLDPLCKDARGCTPLHLAITAGRLNTAQVLAKKAPALLQETDAHGRLPIHLAATRREVALLECLASYSDIESRDGDRMTCLHHACKRGSVECVKYLLESKADPAAGDRFAWNPLHFAARTGNNPIIELLIEYGGTVDKRARKPLHTPLQIAASVGNTASVALLVPRQIDHKARVASLLEAILCATKNAQFACANTLLDMLEEVS